MRDFFYYNSFHILIFASIIAVILIDALIRDIIFRITMRKILGHIKSIENSRAVLEENIIKLKETKAKLSNLFDKVKAQGMSDSLDKVINKLEIILENSTNRPLSVDEAVEFIFTESKKI